VRDSCLFRAFLDRLGIGGRLPERLADGEVLSPRRPVVTVSGSRFIRDV
jgi:hypothetical protein